MWIELERQSVSARSAPSTLLTEHLSEAYMHLCIRTRRPPTGSAMPDDKRDTDIHKPDRLIQQGDIVGHADRESPIRRRDGVIFKGEEIGYVDKRKNIRRPDGIIFRGDIVGQVKDGKRAHAEDGIIFPGEEWGYVDDDGNIRLRDGILFKGRIIGKMRGHNKEAALGYFVLRFKNIEERYAKLEDEANAQ